MGSATDKIKGYANQAAGNVKQGVGKAVGSEEMQVKGGAQELKGKAQVAVGDVKENDQGRRQQGRRRDQPQALISQFRAMRRGPASQPAFFRALARRTQPCTAFSARRSLLTSSTTAASCAAD